VFAKTETKSLSDRLWQHVVQGATNVTQMKINEYAEQFVMVCMPSVSFGVALSVHDRDGIDDDNDREEEEMESEPIAMMPPNQY
jgi:hypothetical protein